MKIETWPLIFVEWDDAQSEGDEWQTFEVHEVKKEKTLIKKCVSVGWLVKETKDLIMVVPHLALKNSTDPQYGRFGAIIIPNCAILKKYELVEKGVDKLTKVK